jgi:hypothetical protein
MRIAALVASVASVACVACTAADPSATSAPTAPNQLTGGGKADGDLTLWAGLASYAFERYAADPCDDEQNALGDAPIVWDEWVRERAGTRNLCFQVWSPGITDTDDPSYWKELDVEVHYRFGTGAWTTAYVPMLDHQGHNLRYAWSMDWSLDPLANAASLVAIGAPLTILSEQNGSAQIAKDLQVYFTVNGETLEAPSGPFDVRFEGAVTEPSLAASPNGLVLDRSASCAGGNLVMGSGAGYFAVDIRDQAAIALLGAGLDGSLIYGTAFGETGAVGAQILSGTVASETLDPGQTMYSYRDRGGTRIYPLDGVMHVEVDVYDRAAGTVRTLATTVGDCAATASP